MLSVVCHALLSSSFWSCPYQSAHQGYHLLPTIDIHRHILLAALPFVKPMSSLLLLSLLFLPLLLLFKPHAQGERLALHASHSSTQAPFLPVYSHKVCLGTAMSCTSPTQCSHHRYQHLPRLYLPSSVLPACQVLSTGQTVQWDKTPPAHTELIMSWKAST